MLVGGVGLLAVAGGGWYVFLRGDDPEAAVEAYFTALDEADAERAEGAVHPDSRIVVYTDYWEDEDPNEFNVDVHEIEERGVEEAIREQWDIEGEALEEEVERTREDLDALRDEHDLDDYAYVYYDITTEGPEYGGYEQEGHILTVEDDGEWYVWSWIY